MTSICVSELHRRLRGFDKFKKIMNNNHYISVLLLKFSYINIYLGKRLTNTIEKQRITTFVCNFLFSEEEKNPELHKFFKM